MDLKPSTLQIAQVLRVRVRARACMCVCHIVVMLIHEFSHLFPSNSAS